MADTLYIAGGQLPAEFLPGATQTEPGFARGEVLLRGGRIVAVGSSLKASAASTLDVSGGYVLPGFVDVHVHGAAGRDTMDADPAALDDMARFFARHGVTGFLATTMTAAHAPTLDAVRAVAAHGGKTPGGARILGVHLEGPYLSPEFPGAQLASDIRPANLVEFDELVEVGRGAGAVRMITLAPEQPDAHALIRAARRRGVTVVAGHTSASYEQFEEAVALGVSQATHTYNAMTSLHHRRPGALGAVLSDDRVDAQLIADNIHVHPAAMKILARCKGAHRTVLVTDAMRAAGLPPGEYELGGQPVFVQEGMCRLADGTLAGSVLTLERGLANFMAAAELSLAQAWPAAGRTPAVSIGLGGEMGRIAAGYGGDLTVVDAQGEVIATVVDGRVAYVREAERLGGDSGHEHALGPGGE